MKGESIEPLKWVCASCEKHYFEKILNRTIMWSEYRGDKHFKRFDPNIRWQLHIAIWKLSKKLR